DRDAPGELGSKTRFQFLGIRDFLDIPFDCQVLAFYPPCLPQTFAKRGIAIWRRVSRAKVHDSRSTRNRRSQLAAYAHKKQSGYHDGDDCRVQMDTISMLLHWIHSVTSGSTAGGIVIPNARGVFALITNSNIEGCSIRRSPGLT